MFDLNFLNAVLKLEAAIVEILPMRYVALRYDRMTLF